MEKAELEFQTEVDASAAVTHDADEQDVVRQRLEAAKQQLLNFRKKQTEYFLKVAEEVATLRRELPKDAKRNLKNWLQEEAGFSVGEARSYLKFDDELATESSSLGKHRTSPDVLTALITSDSKTRSECIVRIKRGETLDSVAVRRMRRANALAAMSADQTARRLRQELFAKATKEFGYRARKALEKDSRDLRELLNPPEETGHPPDQEHGTTSRAADAVISKKAAQLETSLVEFFPLLTNSAQEQGSKGAAEATLFTILSELKMLQRLGPQYSHPSLSPAFRLRQIRQCLEYLAGERSFAGRFSPSAIPRIKGSPIFVDIDAGVGGTALGLEQSGFEAAMVFARQMDGLRALEANRPGWQVKDTLELSAALDSLKGEKVDLLTSGLPWYHYPAYSQDVGSRQQIIKQAAAAVEHIRPRTFIFETLKNDIGDERLVKLFGDRGYDLAWHTVDVSSYGVAQSRHRVVMIGARDGLLKGFSTPVIAPPERRSLAQAAGELVDGYIRNANLAPERWKMERMAVERWRDRWNSELAPDFPNLRKPRAIQKWRRLGIDIQDYDNSEPNRAALVTGFKLNNAILKAIQSFPESWQVEGLSSSNAKLLESSFPPVAARMLGLAIHSALTGLEFDYRRAALKPLENRRRRAYRESHISHPEYVTPASEFLADPNNVIIHHVMHKFQRTRS